MSAFNYPKFQSSKLKVLHFGERGYFLDKEIGECFSQHFEIKQFHMEPGPELIRSLLTEIATFQPDCLLTINYRGFDPEGELFRVLSEIGLDVIVWFVDNPFYLLSQAPIEMAAPFKVFMWDSSYLREYHNRFGVSPSFLPLATSPVFEGTGNFSLDGPRSFVGSSMESSLARITLELPPSIIQPLKELKDRVIKNRGFEINVLIRSMLQEMGFSLDLFSQCEEFLRYWVTQSQRVSLLRKVEVDDLYGDADWGAFFSKSCLRGELEYYSELPKFFTTSGIHLNLTHYQMPKGMNQRVFDVINSGGVLLTDAQEDMLNLFPEWKTWSFESIEQVPEILQQFQTKTDDLKDFFLRLQQKIRTGHMYVHRLEKMCEEIQTQNFRC